MEIKKCYAVVQYNKFIKGGQKSGSVSATLCSPQRVFVYRTLNTNRKVKYKNFCTR
jgi:hypothetical protein